MITDAKMAYFDVRPSSHVPTVELRVCDACPLVDDAILIAGLFRALVAEAGRTPTARPAVDTGRAAAAPGRDVAGGAQRARPATLLDGGDAPEPVPARRRGARRWSTRLRPHLEEPATGSTVDELAEATLARGNSADRQRAAFAERGRLADVVDLVVRRDRGRGGRVAGDRRCCRGLPRRRAGDEAFLPPGVPRPAYRELLQRRWTTCRARRAASAGSATTGRSRPG